MAMFKVPNSTIEFSIVNGTVQIAFPEKNQKAVEWLENDDLVHGSDYDGGYECSLQTFYDFVREVKGSTGLEKLQDYLKNNKDEINPIKVVPDHLYIKYDSNIDLSDICRSDIKYKYLLHNIIEISYPTPSLIGSYLSNHCVTEVKLGSKKIEQTSWPPEGFKEVSLNNKYGFYKVAGNQICCFDEYLNYHVFGLNSFFESPFWKGLSQQSQAGLIVSLRDTNTFLVFAVIDASNLETFKSHRNYIASLKYGEKLFVLLNQYTEEQRSLFKPWEDIYTKSLGPLSLTNLPNVQFRFKLDTIQIFEDFVFIQEFQQTEFYSKSRYTSNLIVKPITNKYLQNTFGSLDAKYFVSSEKDTSNIHGLKFLKFNKEEVPQDVIYIYDTDMAEFQRIDREVVLWIDPGIVNPVHPNNESKVKARVECLWCFYADADHIWYDVQKKQYGVYYKNYTKTRDPTIVNEKYWFSLEQKQDNFNLKKRMEVNKMSLQFSISHENWDKYILRSTEFAEVEWKYHDHQEKEDPETLWVSVTSLTPAQQALIDKCIKKEPPREPMPACIEITLTKPENGLAVIGNKCLVSNSFNVRGNLLTLDLADLSPAVEKELSSLIGSKTIQSWRKVDRRSTSEVIDEKPSNEKPPKLSKEDAELQKLEKRREEIETRKKRKEEVAEKNKQLAEKRQELALLKKERDELAQRDRPKMSKSTENIFKGIGATSLISVIMYFFMTKFLGQKMGGIKLNKDGEVEISDYDVEEKAPLALPAPRKQTAEPEYVETRKKKRKPVEGKLMD